MPLRSVDLVPLLAPPNAGRGVGFRQGVIVAWDPVTAENLVLVGDTVVENLPILNTSEAAILAVGDVVGIFTAGSTWGILGRFTIPGTPEAVSALSSLRTASDSVPVFQSTTSAAYTDLGTAGPAVTVDVGPSGRVLVIPTGDLFITVPGGSAINTATALMSYEMSGANVSAASDLYAVVVEITYDSATTFAPSLRSRVSASKVSLREGLAPGPTTFTAKYCRQISGTASFSSRNLTVMAL